MTAWIESHKVGSLVSQKRQKDVTVCTTQVARSPESKKVYIGFTKVHVISYIDRKPRRCTGCTVN